MAPAGRARADTVNAALEPTFTHVDQSATDQGHATTRSTLDLLTQRYRLSVDRGLTEFLTATVGGSLEDQRGWTEQDRVSSEAHAQSTRYRASNPPVAYRVLTCAVSVESSLRRRVRS